MPVSKGGRRDRGVKFQQRSESPESEEMDSSRRKPTARITRSKSNVKRLTGSRPTARKTAQSPGKSTGQSKPASTVETSPPDSSARVNDSRKPPPDAPNGAAAVEEPVEPDALDAINLQVQRLSKGKQRQKGRARAAIPEPHEGGEDVEGQEVEPEEEVREEGERQVKAQEQVQKQAEAEADASGSDNIGSQTQLAREAAEREEAEIAEPTRHARPLKEGTGREQSHDLDGELERFIDFAMSSQVDPDSSDDGALLMRARQRKEVPETLPRRGSVSEAGSPDLSAQPSADQPGIDSGKTTLRPGRPNPYDMAGNGARGRESAAISRPVAEEGTQHKSQPKKRTLHESGLVEDDDASRAVDDHDLPNKRLRREEFRPLAAVHSQTRGNGAMPDSAEIENAAPVSRGDDSGQGRHGAGDESVVSEEHHLSGPAVDSIIRVDGRPVAKMYQLMGRAGWTGMKQNWEQVIRLEPLVGENDAPSSHDAPVGTKAGKLLWKYLVVYQGTMKEIPKLQHLSQQPTDASLRQQALALREEAQKFKKCSDEINKLLVRICDGYLAADADMTDLRRVKLRKAALNDTLRCLMPLFVSVLQEAFLRGGVQKDHLSQGQKGCFTVNTWKLMFRITKWMSKLHQALDRELSWQRQTSSTVPFAASQLEADTPVRDGAKAARREQAADKRKTEAARNRSSLKSQLTTFQSNLAAAWNSFQQQASLAAAGQEELRRREELRREEEAEQRERMIQAQARHLKLCQASQSLRTAPDPRVERWRTAFGPAPFRGPPAHKYDEEIENGASRGGEDLQQEDEEEYYSVQERADSVPAAAAGSDLRPSPPPGLLQTGPWLDDDLHLLVERVRPVRSLADVEDVTEFVAGLVNRSVPDTREQLRRLQKSCRDLCRKRGLEIEPWAQKWLS